MKEKDFLGKKKKGENLELINEQKDVDIKDIKIKDENKIQVESIKNYLIKKNEEWNKESFTESFDIKSFISSYETHNLAQETYMKKLLNKEDKTDFIEHYSLYQFVLTVKQRIIMQDLFKNNKDIMSNEQIKYNILNENIITIKDIFIKILDSLLSLDYDSLDKNLNSLKDCFRKNGVFINFVFKYNIPTKFGHKDYKYNKLINDLEILFLGEEEINNKEYDDIKIEEIKKRLKFFHLLKQFISKISLFNSDDDIIDTCEYLFVCFKITFEKDQNIDELLLNQIIKTCMPYEEIIAKQKIEELKVCSLVNIIINGYKIIDFKIEQLKSDLLVEIESENKKIKVRVDEINWNINDFQLYFRSDYFMLCFRYKALEKINYIYLNENIHKNYIIYFNKVINSEILKDYMNKDNESDQLVYPFSKEEIIKEIEDNIHLVPLPSYHFSSITDKASFNIYINSIIKTGNLKKVITDYDYFTKTKIHEYKHIYRIYMNLYKKGININTPIILKTQSHKHLLKSKYSEEYKQAMIKMDVIKKINISKDESKEFDYDDLLEYIINVEKINKLFIYNCIFCLKEKTWEKEEYNNFLKSYFSSINKDKFNFTKKKNANLINSIIDFFKFPTDLIYVNTFENKSCFPLKEIFDENGEITNDYISIDVSSHYNLPKP